MYVGRVSIYIVRRRRYRSSIARVVQLDRDTRRSPFAGTKIDFRYNFRISFRARDGVAKSTIDPRENSRTARRVERDTVLLAFQSSCEQSSDDPTSVTYLTFQLSGSLTVQLPGECHISEEVELTELCVSPFSVVR